MLLKIEAKFTTTTHSIPTYGYFILSTTSLSLLQEAHDQYNVLLREVHYAFAASSLVLSDFQLRLRRAIMPLLGGLGEPRTEGSGRLGRCERDSATPPSAAWEQQQGPPQAQ